MKKIHLFLFISFIAIIPSAYGIVIKYTASNVTTGSYCPGRTMSNWTKSTGGAPVMSDFQTVGNEIDLNGRWVNFTGMTIGRVTILNYNTITGAQVRNVPVTGNLTLKINSEQPPIFTVITGTTGALDWSSLGTNGTIEYTYSSTNTQNLIPVFNHYNVRLSNSPKSVSSLYFGGTLTIDNGIVLTCTNGMYLFNPAGGGFAMGTNAKIVYTGTIASMTTAASNYLYTIDERSNKNYQGTHEFKCSTVTGTLYPDANYDKVIITENCDLFYDMLGASKVQTTTINVDLDLSAAKTLKLNTQILEIKGTITNINGAAGGKIIGDEWCSIVCSGNATFYFDQTSSTTKNVNDVNVIASGVFSLGNDILIDSLINLDGGFLNINGQTLKINGLIQYPNYDGYIIGSDNSNLICSSDTTKLYFDQLNDETNRTLKNLTITNSITCTIGNTLNIVGGSSWGTVIVDTLATCSTGNNLTLKSDANGTARIGKSSGTITGEYTVEQYLNAERDYRFLASPVVGGTALHWRDNAPTTATSGRGIHITGGSGSDFDNTVTNKPSAFWYDESKAGDVITINTGGSSGVDDPGYTAFSSAGSTYTLANGTGYRVFVRGDRTLDLSASPAPAANATTIWVKGTYPGYSKTIDVDNSNRAKDNNGMNFLGNPYPSAIDWNLLTRSNVDNGYMVYDYINNSFVGWNGSLGDAGQYISSGQGFFVYCTNNSNTSGGTITIHERNKADEIGGSFFQQKVENHLKINLMYDSSYNSNTHIHFRNDALDTRDQWDIPQMANNGTNVAALDSVNYPYYINSLSQIDSFESIPLSVKGTPAAKLKMSFFDLASFHNHKLELVDNYLKTTVPITEAMVYPFEINSDSLSSENGRFYINFTKSQMASNKIIKGSLIAEIIPNPISNNRININLDSKYLQAQYEILDVTGKKVAAGKINDNKSIDAKSFANGIYFINLTANGTSQTIQFIK